MWARSQNMLCAYCFCRAWWSWVVPFSWQMSAFVLQFTAYVIYLSTETFIYQCNFQQLTGWHAPGTEVLIFDSSLQHPGYFCTGCQLAFAHMLWKRRACPTTRFVWCDPLGSLVSRFDNLSLGGIRLDPWRDRWNDCDKGRFIRISASGIHFLFWFHNNRNWANFLKYYRTITLVASWLNP